MRRMSSSAACVTHFEAGLQNGRDRRIEDVEPLRIIGAHHFHILRTAPPLFPQGSQHASHHQEVGYKDGGRRLGTLKQREHRLIAGVSGPVASTGHLRISRQPCVLQASLPCLDPIAADGQGDLPGQQRNLAVSLVDEVLHRERRAAPVVRSDYVGLNIPRLTPRENDRHLLANQSLYIGFAAGCHK